MFFNMSVCVWCEDSARRTCEWSTLFSKRGLFSVTFCTHGVCPGRAEQHSIGLSSFGKHKDNGPRSPPPTENRHTHEKEKKNGLYSFSHSVTHVLKCCLTTLNRLLQHNLHTGIGCETETASLRLMCFWSECVRRRAAFEITNCHVLCEKQASQPCRAVDLD